MNKRLALLFFLALAVFCYSPHWGCSTDKKRKQIEPDLDIDHLSKVSRKDLYDRIKSFEIEIENMTNRRNDVFSDIKLSKEKLGLQTNNTQKVIDGDRRAVQDLERMIVELDSALSNLRTRAEQFKYRSPYHLQIVPLQDDIQRLDRDLRNLRSSNLDEIERMAIAARFKDFGKNLEPSGQEGELIDPDNRESFIKQFELLRAKYDGKLKEKLLEFENKKDEFSIKIAEDSSKIEDLKKRLGELNDGIVNADETLKTQHQRFAEASGRDSTTMIAYFQRENLLMAKKTAHEIAVLKQRIDLIPKPPESLAALFEKTKALHNSLVDYLSEYNGDLAREQIEFLTQNVDSLDLRIKDFEDLKGLVQKIFNDKVFKEFLALGDTTAEIRPEFYVSNRAFNEHMRTIALFLSIYTSHKIYIDGHSDTVTVEDNPIYGNIELSKRRAYSAKARLLRANIPDSNIVVDWFGEFHPRTKTNSKDAIGSPENRRVEMRVIGSADSSNEAIKYLNFRRNLEFVFDQNPKITFYHNKGYWVENYASGAKLDTVHVKYKSAAYYHLIEKHNVFHSIIKARPSPLYENGTFQIGNQFAITISIGDMKCWMIVSAIGVDVIDDPRIAQLFRNL